MHTCKFCGFQIKGKSRIVRHEQSCEKNPTSRAYRRINGISKPHKPKRIDFHCKWCNTEYHSAHAVGTHENYCDNNPNRKVLSAETRDKLSKSAIQQNKELWTDEFRKKHSNLMKSVVDANPNSYSASNVSGRVKNYEFNGMTFKGTWELVVAKALVNEHIEFTNSIEGVKYFWSETNSYHTYFPDFYIPSLNLYIEVKGYERTRDLDKWKAIPNLVILKEGEIKELQSGISITKYLGTTK